MRYTVTENRSKGFNRASLSLAETPILFVKKSYGSLRLCVDYRRLNAGIIKNRYPLLLMREMLMRLSKARYYTALDIRGAYNLLKVAEGDEWKMVFRMRYGLYESLVMPFGLTNVLADFLCFINNVLHLFLDAFCTAYPDNILIYSETLKEHQAHINKVLEALSKVGLHLKPQKCKFHKMEVKYLGLIISADSVKMDQKKAKAVVEWSLPKNLHNLRAFLGFSNFYRRFSLGYSEVVSPIIKLMKTEIKFA